MKKLMTICLAAMMSVMIVGVANADWVPADGSKMHYPQLPDPQGWDISFNWREQSFADDFKCTATGPITDIHFWGSWKNDIVGTTGKILIQIFSNDTISGGGGSFPKPDEALWSRVITTNQYTSRLYTTGDQGWYDPRYTDHWYEHNHDLMYQYNIPVISNPFVQQAGKTYWLMISMDYLGCDWGWKTSLDVQGNSSVFWDSYQTWGPHCSWWRHPEIDWKWTQLKTPLGCHDPRTPVDLAFVLTTVPEPATLFILAAGAAALLRRRKR